MADRYEEDPPPVPGLTYHGVVIPEICQIFWTGINSEVSGWRWGVRDAKGIGQGTSVNQEEYLRVCEALKAAGVDVEYGDDD